MSQGLSESVDRRRLLQEAIASTVEGETITNAEMMTIWGVTKGRWTDIRNRIPDFPTAVTSNNIQLYPRTAALARMWQWEIRGDAIAADKAKRMAALLGVEALDGTMPTVSDLAKAAQVRADAERRMVEQRLLIMKTEVQRVGAKVFELLSRRLSALGTVADPNGALPAEVRTRLDEAGQEYLLVIHAEMKDMLSPDAAAEPRRPTGAGARSGRAGSSRAPGKRRAGVA